MKIESVEGIVISETNYSESSKILNVLTKEYGRIGIISKGCRNLKSKLRGVSRKLIYGVFHIYYKENGLSTLISVDIKESFSKTMMDLSAISYASYILELIDQVARQNEEENLFSLLSAALLKIEEGLDPLVITNIVELKALAYLGVMPNIDFCSICGSDKAIVTLSSDKGGYICSECYQNEPLVSDKTIKLIRMFYYVDIEKIAKLEVGELAKREINQFLDDYYMRYTGLYLKSKRFIQNIAHIAN